MNNFINSKQYVIFLIIVLMPMNGYIISFNPFLGLFLIILQIPSIYIIINRIDFNER